MYIIPVKYVRFFCVAMKESLQTSRIPWHTHHGYGYMYVYVYRYVIPCIDETPVCSDEEITENDGHNRMYMCVCINI